MTIIRCDRCGKEELDDPNKVQAIFHCILTVKHGESRQKDLCGNCLKSVVNVLTEKMPLEDK